MFNDLLSVLTKNILGGKSRDMLYAAHEVSNLNADRQAKDIIFVYKDTGDSCWTYDDTNSALNELKAGSNVNLDSLVKVGLLTSPKNPLKVLGNGNLKVKLKLLKLSVFMMVIQ